MRLLPVAYALVLALGCPAHAWTPDAWITARLKIALLTSRAMDASAIDVDAFDGKVTLHGAVATAAERTLAEAAAKGIEGVVEVRNLVAIVTPKDRRSVQRSDDSIRRKVSAALAKDAERIGGAVAVQSVNGGIVLLSGNTKSSSELLRAIQVARRVRGVKGVASEIRTSPADADLDVWTGTELRQDGSSLSGISSDLWTTAAVRLSLIADDEVPASDVNVDTNDGVVTLFGSVATEDQKDEAEDTAEDVDDVRRVRNLLQVVPAAQSARVMASDEELAGKVNEAVYARPEMRGASIDVAVRNRVIRLSGSAPTRQHRVWAAHAARRVPGVRAVHEDIAVASITRSTKTEKEDE